MNPNNNQPLPVDYLDQIATGHQKKSGPLQSKPLVIGLIIALLIAALLTIFNSLNSSSTSVARLAARLTVTAGMHKTSTTAVQDSDLKSINSELNIYLTNTLRDIEPIMVKNGTKTANLDKKLLASESVAKTLTKLEDARLNGIYDRTYSREMSYQLQTIMVLLRQLYKSSNNSDTKTFLQNSYDNLLPIQQKLANFSL